MLMSLGRIGEYLFKNGTTSEVITEAKFWVLGAQKLAFEVCKQIGEALDGIRAQLYFPQMTHGVATQRWIISIEARTGRTSIEYLAKNNGGLL